MNIADYYSDKNDNEVDYETSYVLYDAREVFYPVYKSLISYQTMQIKNIHPIIFEILKIIDELHKIQKNNIQQLQKITQLDDEILTNILNSYCKFIELSFNDEITLKKEGKEALKERKNYKNRNKRRLRNY